MAEMRIQDQLSDSILLSERIRSAIEDAAAFKLECSEMGKQVHRISQMLRSVMRLASSVSSLYDRPVRRVVAEVSKNLLRALTLARKCKRRSILRRVVSVTSSSDFRRICVVLDASIGDLKWLLSIFSFSGGIVLSLPPIACNDPIIAWIWSSIASIQMSRLTDRIEAANELAFLALDNDRNKKIIVVEGGIPPLLKLLKEFPLPDGQIAAAIVLFNLANDRERVRVIGNEVGVRIIVQVLGYSPVMVQIRVANLVARMAEYDRSCQEGFARENAIRPLVALLSFETLADGDMKGRVNKQMRKCSTIESNKSSNVNCYPTLYSSLCPESVSWLASYRKERENEKPEVKLKLKISCSEALWMLAKGSVSNSRRITETKGLLCLAKLVEKEKGELQLNCLMIIMEITAAAESNADLRRAVFKTNSPAAKAVVEQLLRVIKEVDIPSLQLPAIKAIGSLARTFPARETRVIIPIVTHLSHINQDVATEAAITLTKFVCPENFLRADHSKAIIQFNAIPPLMRLLRGSERTQLQVLNLLCYLTLHVNNGEALEQARVLNALKEADCSTAAKHPELRDLLSKAIYHLTMYHAGHHSQRLS